MKMHPVSLIEFNHQLDCEMWPEVTQDKTDISKGEEILLMFLSNLNPLVSLLELSW